MGVKSWAPWVVGALISTSAAAHPMSRDKYSLRTAMRLADTSLDAVVVLEVPLDIVTGGLKASLAVAQAAGGQGRQEAKAVIEAYAEAQWARMAKGLTLSIDGVAVPGAWTPRDDRYNGKGAVTEGFFLYIVEFTPTGQLPLDGDVTVRIHNTSFDDVPMVYSAWVVAGEGWDLRSHSATDALPKGGYNLNDPAFWVEDASLRTLEAHFVTTP